MLNRGLPAACPGLPRDLIFLTACWNAAPWRALGEESVDGGSLAVPRDWLCSVCCFNPSISVPEPRKNAAKLATGSVGCYAQTLPEARVTAALLNLSLILPVSIDRLICAVERSGPSDISSCILTGSKSYAHSGYDAFVLASFPVTAGDGRVVCSPYCFCR